MGPAPRLFHSGMDRQTPPFSSAPGSCVVLSVADQGRGTTECLVLPTAPATEPVQPLLPSKAPDDLERERAPSTFLVVEDQDDMRRTMVRVLERGGYLILIASNGGDVLRALRSEGIRIPFALATGGPDPGGDASIPLIPNPWTVSELLEWLSKILVQEGEV